MKLLLWILKIFYSLLFCGGIPGSDVETPILERCWRQFLRSRKTTFALAKEYDALEINEKSVKSMQFEQLALRIESAGTLQIVNALLDRLENRLTLSRSANVSSNPSSLDNIDHLLKRLASPRRKSTPSNTTKSRRSRKLASNQGGQDPAKLSRYPVRVLLCAYMILGHPDAVFNGQGEHEKSLAESAAGFTQEFELLIKMILYGPSQNTHLDSSPALPSRNFRTQLQAFDAAWCTYVYRFVVWKVKDARSLEEDLVRAACQMELSMMQTCKLTAEGENNLTHDMKAVQKQVTEDQKLLREKVQHLSGDDGVQRMECALSDARSKYYEAKESGSPIISPIAHILSPDHSSSSAGPLSVLTSAEITTSIQGGETPSRVVRSLFKNDALPQPEGLDSSSPSSGANHLGPSNENLITDNELLVNEIIHERHYVLADSLDVNNEGPNAIKAKIKDTMEKAFWNGIAESLKRDEPDYGRIVELVKEVRDELSEMAPRSWKQNIYEVIDLDILSQVMMSGIHDLSYLGNILEFALVTLQKLSAPASEDEMIKSHKTLMDELHETSQAGDESNTSFVFAMIKGLRFVLEQIQILKRDISKARIRLLEPVIQGPAGFEYLRKAFGNRYGSPSNASNSLPLTVQWLLSMRSSVDQVWDEYTDSLSCLSTRHASSTNGLPPYSALRTGGSISIASKIQGKLIAGSAHSENTTTGNNQPECSGDRIDKMVRHGLVKLTSGIEGVTQENIPETLKLNFSRLRNVQAQLQKIIVISASILVLRQVINSEKLATSAVEIENALSNSVERLTELLDSVEDVGITDIVETINESLDCDSEKLQSRKEALGNMLIKSLRADDPVFTRVSSAVYLAATGVVFGGSGLQGRELAETTLRRVGAAVLTGYLMKAVEVLIVVAMTSCNIHRPWYEELTKSM
ncbi:T-complex protein [Thalictrum thalictroides]|uniref:T-complex protein n=1 Tax=Thalictrum thalictroides TaxID=46969 RepID=A0A7J6W2M5_THATH|nr:T-complex protein [Thalictrum thalictroides]